MGFYGCKDHVYEIVDEGTKVFARRFDVNKDRYDGLAEICDLVDAFIEYTDAEYLDVSVDETTTELEIVVGCDEVVFYDDDNEFFSLIKLVDSFAIYKEAGADRIRIALRIKNVWRLSDG